MSRVHDLNGRLKPPRPALSSDSLEALKWLALVFMTLDHVNTFLYDGKFPALFDIGRIAMPVFGFVLACNLARGDALERGVYHRTMKRLALFGLLATPVFIALVGWRPLNIMFTLLVATGVMYLIERNGPSRSVAALLLLAAGGAVVEFSWYGLLYCLAAWLYCKRTTWPRLMAWIATAASLYAINHNLWALAALPVIFTVPRLRLRVPRVRHLFYFYYPAHLAILWASARFAQSQAGLALLANIVANSTLLT